MHFDVTSEQDQAQVVDAVLKTHGRFDILFNNAGVGFPAIVEKITVDIWDRAPAVHARGVFLGARTLIPAMPKGGDGSNNSAKHSHAPPSRQRHRAAIVLSRYHGTH